MERTPQNGIKALEALFVELQSSLQSLTSLYLKFMEFLRSEHEALLNADLKEIEKNVGGKRGILHQIHGTEEARMKLMEEIKENWMGFQPDTPAPASITQWVIHLQGIPGGLNRFSSSLQTSSNVLNLLLKRIEEQSRANRNLIENALHHIDKMKKNIFHQSSTQPKTYNHMGKQCERRASSHFSRST